MVLLCVSSQSIYSLFNQKHIYKHTYICKLYIYIIVFTLQSNINVGKIVYTCTYRKLLYIRFVIPVKKYSHCQVTQFPHYFPIPTNISHLRTTYIKLWSIEILGISRVK